VSARIDVHVPIAMAIVIFACGIAVGGNRGTYRSTHRRTDNRAFAVADFIADNGARGTTRRAAYGGFQLVSRPGRGSGHGKQANA
jgi:predicted lipase